MNRIGFGSFFLNVIIGLALALAACDGGGYDASAHELRSPSAAVAQATEDRPAQAAAEALPREAFAPAPANIEQLAPAVAEARRAALEAGSFDTFSRPPPPPPAAPRGG